MVIHKRYRHLECWAGVKENMQSSGLSQDELQLNNKQRKKIKKHDRSPEKKAIKTVHVYPHKRHDMQQHILTELDKFCVLDS